MSDSPLHCMLHKARNCVRFDPTFDLTRSEKEMIDYALKAVRDGISIKLTQTSYRFSLAGYNKPDKEDIPIMGNT